MFFRISRSCGLLFLLAFTMSFPSAGQTVSIGADLVSRYIWRGLDFGESASVQPGLSVGFGRLEIGTWASYAVSPAASSVNEHDLWVSYGFETPVGTVTAGVTDYYFPNAGPGFLDFSGDGRGAHWIEPFLSFDASGGVPVHVYAGYFVHNDPDGSVYVRLALPIEVQGTDLTFSGAVSGGRSALYATDSFGIVELGVSAARSIPITGEFNLPIMVSYLVNPYIERSYLVFGLSF